MKIFGLGFCLLCVLLYSYLPAVKGKYSSTETAAHFYTSDSTLQKLYNEAERKCAWNIQQFGAYQVLVEGAGYQNVWLETQPMGGYMFAKRNLQVAKNNQLIFIDHQREDGRLPGMISMEKGKLVPHYGWFQGFCFPESAFELSYWLANDKEFLQKLYSSLERFDAYLWKTRDSDSDGCLETWCIWDTGEDNCTRLAGAPNQWPFETAPDKRTVLEKKGDRFFEHYDPATTLPVPMESMDIMSYSFACRDVLQQISKELSNGRELYWRDKAGLVKKKIKSYLWNEKKSACFDRDPSNQPIPTLVHNNLRCMYFNSFDQQMANAFIKNHLMNKAEFWTPMPLPSIAANDPAFRNAAGNNWSGQPQGLTFQRAIRALENYGHYAELSLIGFKLIDATKSSLHFTQQFDPFTGKPNQTSDGYGPTMLSVLEYISRMYGVHFTQNKVYWSNLNEAGIESQYDQKIGDKVYKLSAKEGVMKAFINGKEVFACTTGVRVVTDAEGNLLEVIGIRDKPQTISLRYKEAGYAATISPNAVYGVEKKKLGIKKSQPFYPPFKNDQKLL